jgi:hypothetical protein
MDQEPNAARCWPPKFNIIYVHRVGPKCIVKQIPDEDGMWWEMGGRIAYDQQDSETDIDSQDTHLSGDDDFADVAKEGGVGIDRSQTRVYYRWNTTKNKHECRIVLPSDFHFRRSQKGHVPSRSKSFKENKMPLPEVLLLYALKTGELEDRRAAVEAFPSEIWDAQTFGQLFGAMDDASKTHHNFCIFAGEWLASAASRHNGLGDWSTWEKVADAAMLAKQEAASHLSNVANQNTHVMLLRALRDSVVSCRGLPAQKHVRANADSMTDDQWKDLLHTMAVRWLPAERDWKRFFKLDENRSS